MRPRAGFAVALLAGGCASATPQDPCEHLFGVTVEFQTNPTGDLEKARFAEVIDCRQNPVALHVPLQWKQVACGVLASWREPTYVEGQRPQTRWTFFVYDTNRPNAVIPPAENSAKNPVVYFDESIAGMPPASDTLGVCAAIL